MESVKTSSVRLVRSCRVGYNLTKQHEDDTLLYHSMWRMLERSIQRLTLLLPIEEQKEDLTVSDYNVHAAVKEGSGERVPETLDNEDISGQELENAGDRLTEQDETTISNHAPNVIKSTLSPSAKEFVPAHL